MIDVLSDVWERAFINMLLDVWTIGVWNGVVTAVLTVITVGVDLLADVKVTVLLAVTNALAFAAAL